MKVLLCLHRERRSLHRERRGALFCILVKQRTTPGDTAAVSCEILQLNLWLLIVTEGKH